MGLSAYLMVSTWRFWSAKEINFSRRHPFQLLVPLAMVAYVVIRYSNTALFLAALVLYVFGHLGARGVRVVAAPPQKAATVPAPAPPEPEPLGPRFSE